VESGRAYYVLDQGGVVFIVLDTVNRAGFSDGSIDGAQFQWLEGQLAARSSSYYDPRGTRVATINPDRVVVVVSHHAPDRMLNPFVGEGGGERFTGNDLEEMLHRFPNVVLHVTGHALQQRITARPDVSDSGRGSYWEVATAGPLDWPMQGRLLEIVDNRDGTLSIFSTVYDSSAPMKPGDADDPTPEDGLDQSLLAAVGRQIAFEDPQRDADAAGLQPSDRNAELIVAAPFDTSLLPTPTPAAREPD
jgi:hypothetical protein